MRPPSDMAHPVADSVTSRRVIGTHTGHVALAPHHAPTGGHGLGLDGQTVLGFVIVNRVIQCGFKVANRLRKTRRRRVAVPFRARVAVCENVVDTPVPKTHTRAPLRRSQHRHGVSMPMDA